MQRLNKIENGEIIYEVLVSRFNAVVDAVNALGEIHGDNITIAVDEALGYCIRALDQPTPPGGASETGGTAELGVLVSVPSAGSGQGTYQKIALGPGGEVIPVGDVLPVVIPKLYHYQKGS